MSLVLVSGATGFMATHVIKQLLEAGYKVRGTVRDAKNEKKYQHLFSLTPNAKANLTIVQADLLDAASWGPAVKDCKYICHVASPFPAGNPKNEDDLIVPAREGTLNVLKAAANEKCVKRVVVTSSLAAICEGGGNPKTLDEKDWANPDNLSSMIYNKSKVVAEKAAWDFHASLKCGHGKFEMCTVNPVIVTGPCLHASAGTSVQTVKMLLDGSTPMVPPFILPLVDVRDVAAAQVKCLTSSDAKGHRHLLYSYNLWMKEMGDILRKEFGPQGYSVPEGEMPLDVVREAAKNDDSLQYSVTFTSAPMLLNNHRFTKVLGITPISKEKSICDTAYSLVEMGILPKTPQYKGPK